MRVFVAVFFVIAYLWVSDDTSIKGILAIQLFASTLLLWKLISIADDIKRLLKEMNGDG